MLPSSTVENYLKAIYLGVASVPADHLLPMGQLASALGVAPGTATTMVKALAESGLVQYEPYAGVTLTAAGEKLAAVVLRRHRLIELFLVRVMGYSWDEVHDEAEQLEHAVTDRLIDRMDDMLGRPEVDPHGDPIPSADGRVKEQDAESLLTCPLQTPVTVMRVLDQDRAFLRFIEQHDLKPGQAIQVEHRDAAADSVRVRGKDDQRITIGTRAASKLLVQVARALLLVAAVAAPVHGQDPPDPSDSSRPFEILDNSIFVEEAFNQEAGVVQNLLTIQAAGGDDWAAAFTQEWPLLGHRHQISYTLTFLDAGAGGGFGDTMINYRLQVTDEAPGRAALSPRLSIILPTGRAAARRGGDGTGWQVNLPVSKQLRDVYLHGNAGLTDQGDAAPHVAGSAIVRVRPMFNVMIEGLAVWRNGSSDAGSRNAIVTISPGFRAGWNSGDKQTVIAVGLPIERNRGTTSVAVVGYVSYELPFN